MLWEAGSENDADIRDSAEIKFNLLSLWCYGERFGERHCDMNITCPIIDMWHMGNWHLTSDPTSRSDQSRGIGNEPPSFLSRIRAPFTGGPTHASRETSQNWSSLSRVELSLMGPQQPLSLIDIYFRQLGEIRWKWNHPCKFPNEGIKAHCTYFHCNKWH